MRFSAEQRLVVVGRPLFRVVGDEVFILMPDSQMHWLRNATARHLWESLLASGAAGRSAAELADELAEEFEVTTENALADVLAFVGELGDKRLVAAASDD